MEKIHRCKGLAMFFFFILFWLWVAGNSFSGIHSRNLPDLDVTYISREPQCYRYEVEYPETAGGPGIPVLKKGTEQLQRWPRTGEKVTYSAHVLNKGAVSSAPSTGEWCIDGRIAAKEKLPAIQPGEEKIAIFSTTWPASPQTITFALYQNNQQNESALKNNTLSTGSHDLTISIWVEKGLYDLFNRTKNMTGSYSFEDWIEAQIAVMNDRFAKAKYPVAPRGILDRLRIQKIVIAEDLDGPGNPMESDPDLYRIDGRWQFKDNDVGNGKGRSGMWQECVDKWATATDWGLIHEIAHQLGIIDLYRLNLANDPPHNNGIAVKDRKGKVIPYSKLPTAAYGQVLFSHPDIMAGGDTSPYHDGTYFSSHTAAAMNTNYGHRRGFYGDYLFDTPHVNRLKVFNASGKPLTGAKVEMFQKDWRTEVIDNTPEITGMTDGNGILQLPNRNVKGVTTVTGHTLRPNPFGQICVVGTNGTMLVRISKGEKEDFSWFFILDLNLACWSGNRDIATYIIKTKW